MILKYIDSDGKAYNLLDARFRLRNGNFHKMIWKFVALTKQYGVQIEKFEKDPISLDLEFVVKGNVDKRKSVLNQLHASMEKDKLNNLPGRILWGDEYLEGYFIESNTYPEKDHTTINDTVFLAPYPFWITEQHIQIGAISEVDAMSETTGTKTYPYTYPYRYSLLQTETTYDIDHYTDSHFKMIVYGPTTGVQVNIAGHPYSVAYSLEDGEYMVIDSRPYVDKEKRLYVVRANGDTENIFDYRSAEHRVFQKIPPGRVKIDYSRTYGIDLTIFKERSEPLWK